MALDVVMPKWGLTMKSGKIARWLVEEGAQISAGMPLLEVETDKITNVVEERRLTAYFWKLWKRQEAQSRSWRS